MSTRCTRGCRILGDAVHDGLIPQPGQQRAYIASTGQVWSLHDTVPQHLAPAILLAP